TAPHGSGPRAPALDRAGPDAGAARATLSLAMTPSGGMRPRYPREPHRVASPLELLFDLCFVVAVAQASAHLHHGLTEAHFTQAIVGYLLVFFPIWWAWMNFTWFASAYDTDDVPYRLAVL